MIKKVTDYIASHVKSEILTFGDNLFINFYPEQPDLIVSVIDLGGYPPDLYAPTREKVIELKYRASTHDKGATLGNELLNLFHSKENYNLDGMRILHSYARTDANYLYTDSNENEEFSIELVFLIER